MRVGIRAPATQETVDERIARLGLCRHGIFSRDEALAAGATPSLISRRLTANRWERLAPGIYRLSGVPETWQQSLLVACLASAGQHGTASHRSAAALRGLAGVEQVLEVTAPRGKRRRLHSVVQHEGHLPAVDVMVFDSIPVTTPTRTLIDLGAVIPADVLEEALDDALRRSLTSIPRLKWRIDALAQRGRPGIGAIKALLRSRDPGEAVAGSVLETRFVRLVRRAKLPRPVPQFAVRENGRLIAVVDFAYPDVRLAIEVDGYRWHSGRGRWQADLNRRNRLTAAGWRVVHFTSADLRDRPAWIVETTARALAETPGR